MWAAILPLSLLAPLTTPPCVLGGGTLRTCVLRPPGIYGPEEQRHLPRVAVGRPSPRSHVSLGAASRAWGPQFWEMPRPHRPTRNRAVSVCQPGPGTHGHKEAEGVCDHQHKGLPAENLSPEQARCQEYRYKGLWAPCSDISQLVRGQCHGHRFGVARAA